MKKEEIITMLIIIIVVTLEIITQKHTQKAVEEVNTKLLEVKEQAIAEEDNKKELLSKTIEIYNVWEEKSKTLSCYLEHDELEKVDLKLRTIKSSFESNGEVKDEVVAEIEEGIFSLEHIKDKQKLNLKNIL